MFSLLSRPVAKLSQSLITSTSVSTLFVRTLMKSHKGAAKRWRKTSNGFKRGQAARNHGNTGWSSNVLKGDGSKAMSTKEQTKRLNKLLPYH
jgi:ribosomal protein L35